MDRCFQTQNLHNLIHGEWGSSSISVHNRVANVRALLDFIGEDYLQLESAALEIETISGTALGMGDERLSEDDQTLLSEQVDLLKARLSLIEAAERK